MARILIVDDAAMITTLASSVLRQAGHEVAVRNEALGTSSFAIRFAPDLILMDVEMPALSGDKLSQILKKNGSTANVPIVLFSSKNDAELEVLSAQAETAGYISKSKIKMLATCIRPYLRGVA